MNRLLYATRARRAILDVLRSERRYLTAADIAERLDARTPHVATSTVYRTLEMLESLGSVSRKSGDERTASFVYCAEEHHHHAICRICGAVEDVECEALELIRRSLERQRSFELDEHEIAFYGRCARCRTRNGKKARPDN